MEYPVQSSERPPEADTFSDFVKLAVPKFAQRTTGSRWKYDVQRKEKQLTIFRLEYKDDTVAVGDCLCLRFFSNPANPSADLFIPIYSCGGQKIGPAFIMRVLGKGIVTSPQDIRTILLHLDSKYGEDAENIEKDSTAEKSRCRGENYVDSLNKQAVPIEKGFVDDSSEDFIPEDRNDVTSPSRDTSPEVVAVKAKRKKRPAEEPLLKSSSTEKPSKKRRLVVGVVGEEVDEEILAEMQLKSSLKLNVKDMPSAPPYSECGGTIFSSQYWQKAAAARQKLNCDMDVFVDKKAIKSIKSLAAAQLPFPIALPVQDLVRSVAYAWVLLEHLLGGWKAISRSFTYTSSGTCPIERKELVKIVVNLCDAVLEHMERTSSLENKDVVHTEVLALLQPLTNIPYKNLKGSKEQRAGERTRVPSDLFLREYLNNSSYPEEGKVQVADGFDLYLDEKQLANITRHYKDGAEELEVLQRWGGFAMDIAAELAGGTEVLHKGQKESRGSILALIGDDIFEAIWARAQKTFGKELKPTLKDFRASLWGYLRPPKRRGTAVDVSRNAPLMASILFRADASGATGLVPLPDVDDAPAEAGCNYWTRPAPHRTRLSPNWDIYMQTARLVEYQRYLGPERAKIKMVRAGAEYALYLKALVPYAVGGEEAFLKRVLQQKNAMRKGKRVALLDDALKTAIFEHVERLFEIPTTERKSATEKLRDCLEVFAKRQLELYTKGQTRWHFPELDERPKSEAVALLEAQEYWRKPAPDRTELRPGHDVYITTKLLQSIVSYFGPTSRENCIKKYNFALLVHMLGGPGTVYEFWDKKTFYGGLRSLFVFDDLVAVCLHSDEVFHLLFSITPNASLIYANARMQCYKDHETRRIKRGGRERQVVGIKRDGDSLHLALSVT
ncbi:hypothetical protein RvY_02742 [Ramazzottius varieornatus]|uniref:Uncharacterized protein n=1 Tax=Ramazzottius varieornatus TaxID=947166 RepID=A0A1D1USU8_RAMVA|nr:hypothetical protein RvY_02742 [Ramazzottius varieornatus]